MKITVTESIFRNQFEAMGRGDQFSHKALGWLFDMLDDFDNENEELDVIAICCDFNELKIEDVRSEYDVPEDQDVIDYLEENTFVVNSDDETVVFQAF